MAIATATCVRASENIIPAKNKNIEIFQANFFEIFPEGMGLFFFAFLSISASKTSLTACPPAQIKNAESIAIPSASEVSSVTK